MPDSKLKRYRCRNNPKTSKSLFLLINSFCGVLESPFLSFRTILRKSCSEHKRIFRNLNQTKQ